MKLDGGARRCVCEAIPALYYALIMWNALYERTRASTAVTISPIRCIAAYK